MSKTIHETLSPGHARIANHRARIRKHHHGVVAEVVQTLKSARQSM